MNGMSDELNAAQAEVMELRARNEMLQHALNARHTDLSAWEARFDKLLQLAQRL